MPLLLSGAAASTYSWPQWRTVDAQRLPLLPCRAVSEPGGHVDGETAGRVRVGDEPFGPPAPAGAEPAPDRSGEHGVRGSAGRPDERQVRLGPVGVAQDQSAPGAAAAGRPGRPPDHPPVPPPAGRAPPRRPAPPRHPPAGARPPGGPPA